MIGSLVPLGRGELGQQCRHDRRRGNPDGLERCRLHHCRQEARDWITAVAVAFEPPYELLPQPLDLA